MCWAIPTLLFLLVFELSRGSFLIKSFPRIISYAYIHSIFIAAFFFLCFVFYFNQTNCKSPNAILSTFNFRAIRSRAFSYFAQSRFLNFLLSRDDLSPRTCACRMLRHAHVLFRVEFYFMDFLFGRNQKYFNHTICESLNAIFSTF